MSLNTAHANGGVLIFSGERILIFYNGVEMAFELPGNMPHFKGTKKGRAYLTTHRVIFNTLGNKDTLQSFSMPFYCMKEVELEQPVFGANYIKGKVNAEMGGNWEGSGKWKMWFNKGGAIEFGRTMLQAGKLASRYAPAAPPPYSPPAGPYYEAPPPAYAPPTAPLYSFVPYQTFPDQPPANGVYMTEAPPPYPGIDPNLTPYPPAQANGQYPPGQAGAPYSPPMANGQPQNLAAAKAAEAAASGAYYAPQDPHSVYMPQPQAPPYPSQQAPPYPTEAPPYPTGAPPAYEDVAKKKDQ